MLNTKKLSKKVNSEEHNVHNGGNNDDIQINNNTNTNTNNNNTLIQKNPTVVNNYNIINKSTNLIIVKHDKEKNTFSFYDNSNNFIGAFSVLELFKYINKDSTFLIATNINSSKDIIEKYICVNKIDKCEIVSHLDSPFTNNIELMAGLYSDIIKVEEQLNSELVTKSDIEEITKIKNNNTNFIYELLMRILKLSNLLIDQIDSNPANHNQKDTLIRYSVGALNKICKMTKDEILVKIMKIDTIDNKINKLEKIQQNIESQIASVDNKLEQQNKNILQILQIKQDENSTIKHSDTNTPHIKNNSFSPTSPIESVKNNTNNTRSLIDSYRLSQIINDTPTEPIITDIKNLL